MNFSHLLIGFSVLIFTSCNSDSTNAPSNEVQTEGAKTEGAKTIGDLGIPDGKYTLTKETPSINWTATKITGDSHYGIIPAKQGKFIVENGVITKGVISFDMNGFEVTDLDGESKENFDGHLKSDDFFDVENFPTARLNFNKTSINEKGEKQVSFTLDMHGVEVDYLIPFKLAEKKMEYGSMGYRITGEFLMDRTKHGLTYGSGSFFDDLGDRVINDEVKLSFEFVAL
jgi:polyisoprenoid-binding protein YceI